MQVRALPLHEIDGVPARRRAFPELSDAEEELRFFIRGKAIAF